MNTQKNTNSNPTPKLESLALQKDSPNYIQIPIGIVVHQGKFLIPTSVLKEVSNLIGEYKNFYEKDFVVQEQYITFIEKNKIS